ncbi:methenyltetrahydrofolate synthase domain-containing protein [Ochotona curzoniae]|uniref:methenyltetrahydrofolate synthase domain-containing protein n=1 Tax=Ochotona curzoniae TaxID=130825 RepID=UPI001B34AB06|nr:methenyltetrahydrofolate synthase domain-containing protein [Ochotona curzoniae]
MAVWCWVTDTPAAFSKREQNCTSNQVRLPRSAWAPEALRERRLRLQGGWEQAPVRADTPGPAQRPGRPSSPGVIGARHGPALGSLGAPSGDVTSARAASRADDVDMDRPAGPPGGVRGSPVPQGEGVSKHDIRQHVWDYLESHNLADFPRPVHHRIPNFKGSYLACRNIQDLDVFASAREVKVDPDKPLEGVRLLALQSKKTLLVPTPRLRTGLFNKITPPPGATKDILRRCATSEGVRSHSLPVGLESRVQVDIVVVGSVAVSEKGWRIGKGEGYADLEYAMMVSMGAVHRGTPVVTIVHDCQVRDIPEALVEDHDITVDYILTPTRIIVTGCERPQPAGVMWSKVSHEMMEKIPILRSLRRREEQAGKDVALQEGPRHSPPLGRQHGAPPGGIRRHQEPQGGTCGAPQREDRLLAAATVSVGNLPFDARVSDLKRALRELGQAPLQLTWQGPRRPALLRYQDPASAQQAVSCLQGLRLGANTLTVALARQQRGR